MQVNYASAVSLIAAVGQVHSVLVRGQPGVGKSSMQYELARMFPEHVSTIVDCATLMEGDFAMPVVDRERMVTDYALNSRFGISKGSTRPVLLCFDEMTKCPSKAVLNMLLPVYYDRRHLPPGSIVWATGNLLTDGVGDILPAHVGSRGYEVDFRNPTTDEWLQWAVLNGIHPVIIMYVKETPQVFERYDTLGSGSNRQTNPRIFDPIAGQVRRYVCPRTLVMASTAVHVRSQIGEAFLPALAGAVGEFAAHEIMARVALADKLPTRAAIAAAPAQCKLPEDAAAASFLAYALASADDMQHLAAYVQYISRWSDMEAVVLFTETLSTRASRAGVLSKVLAVPGFTALAARCGKYY